jgi:hypothetical protein
MSRGLYIFQFILEIVWIICTMTVIPACFFLAGAATVVGVAVLWSVAAVLNIIALIIHSVYAIQLLNKLTNKEDK